MKTVTYIQNTQVIGLSKVATIKGDRVSWSYGTYVSFRRQGGHIVIKTVNDDYSMNILMYGDDVSSLSGEEVNMVMAAMTVLGVTSAMVGSGVLIMAVAANPEVIVVRETRRPATTWDTAADFTLSQNRPEPEDRPRRTTRVHYETNVPPITLPKTKTGWAMLGLAAVAVVAVSAIAATSVEQ